MKSNMWHEARRQERKIRGMLVDYRKRAERRRDFYEKIKADPTQFLQVHGRQCKIHLDPNVAAAAGSSVMMPWQGQSDILIDRFDVRAHLDYIPSSHKEDTELTQEERQLNYERYRIIAQNSFLCISEEKFLKQLHMEEQFGYTETKGKKEQKSGGATIGFNYEEGTGTSQPFEPEIGIDSDDESIDSDLDVDLAINISKMEPVQAHEMNKHGRQFGMSSNDFYSFLINDLEEAESYRQAKEEEQEKALFAGRKSRRERRYHREKRLANRVISPPSYMAQRSPIMQNLRESKSLTRSPSPENSGKITYITSFGDEEEPQTSSKLTYAEKLKQGKVKNSKSDSSERIVFLTRYKSRSNSRDRNRCKGSSKSRATSGTKFERDRSKRKRSASRSRSGSRSSYKPRRRSRSRSRFIRSRSRSRNRQRSEKRNSSDSFSRRSRSPSRKRNSDRRSVTKITTSTSRSAKRHSSASSSASSSSATEISNYGSKLSEPMHKHKPVTFSESNADMQEDIPVIEPKIDSAKATALPRYYGRRKCNESSSELSGSEPDDWKGDIQNSGANLIASDLKSGIGNKTGTAIKKTSVSLTITEKLKRKRQAQLNKQYKADKIAEQLKTERERQEQQSREDELREMVIKFRRRQREKRHAYDSDNSSYSDSDASEKSKSSNLGQMSSSFNIAENHSPPGMRDLKARHNRDSDRFSKDRRDQRDSSRDRKWNHRSPSPHGQGNKSRSMDGKSHSRRDDPKSSKSLVDYD